MTKKKPVLVQFESDLLQRLDKLGEVLGRSRSSIVRDAVERYVATESEAEKDRRLIEGYTRFPDDGEWDEWAARSGKDLLEQESW